MSIFGYWKYSKYSTSNINIFWTWNNTNISITDYDMRYSPLSTYQISGKYDNIWILNILLNMLYLTSVCIWFHHGMSHTDKPTLLWKMSMQKSKHESYWQTYSPLESECVKRRIWLIQTTTKVLSFETWVRIMSRISGERKETLHDKKNPEISTVNSKKTRSENTHKRKPWVNQETQE